jgi:hypothetical protein
VIAKEENMAVKTTRTGVYDPQTGLLVVADHVRLSALALIAGYTARTTERHLRATSEGSSFAARLRTGEIAAVARRNVTTVEKHLIAAGITPERRPHVSPGYGRWVGLDVARAYVAEHGRPEPKEETS